MKLNVLCALPLLAASTGCFHITYRTHLDPEPAPAYEAWHHDFVDGLVEATPAVALDQIRPQGFAQVDERETFVNGLVSDLVQLPIAPLPFRLWSPKTVEVTCAKPSPGPRAG